MSFTHKLDEEKRELVSEYVDESTGRAYRKTLKWGEEEFEDALMSKAIDAFEQSIQSKLNKGTLFNSQEGFSHLKKIISIFGFNFYIGHIKNANFDTAAIEIGWVKISYKEGDKTPKLHLTKKDRFLLGFGGYHSARFFMVSRAKS